MQNLNTIQDLYTTKILVDNLNDIQEISARARNIESQLKSFWLKNDIEIYDFYTLKNAFKFRVPDGTVPDGTAVPVSTLMWHIPDQNVLYMSTFKTASSSLNNFFQLVDRLGTSCYQNQQHLESTFNYQHMTYQSVDFKNAYKVMLFREPMRRLESAFNMMVRQSKEQVLGSSTIIYPWAMVDPSDTHLTSQLYAVPIEDVGKMSFLPIITFAALCTPNWRKYFDEIDIGEFHDANMLFNCVTSTSLFLKLVYDFSAVCTTTQFYLIEKADDVIDPFSLFSREFLKFSKNNNPIALSFTENASSDKNWLKGKTFHKDTVDYVNMHLDKKPYVPTEGIPVNRSLRDMFLDQLAPDLEFYNLMRSREYRDQSKYRNIKISLFRNIK